MEIASDERQDIPRLARQDEQARYQSSGELIGANARFIIAIS
jgi:hypothetical protein